MLSRTCDNTTSQNIGGDGCMGGPHLNFFGDRPPSLPGFHPWAQLKAQLKKECPVNRTYPMTFIRRILHMHYHKHFRYLEKKAQKVKSYFFNFLKLFYWALQW